MRKKGVVILVLSVCCILGVSIFFIHKSKYESKYKSLPEIKIDEVQYLGLHNENITERDKIEEFLEYYNQIYEVVDNDGTWNMTSEHMLVVYLKSGAE